MDDNDQRPSPSEGTDTSKHDEKRGTVLPFAAPAQRRHKKGNAGSRPTPPDPQSAA